MDGLLNAVLPFAQQMLERHGEFYPYAATMTQVGEIEMKAGDPGAGEHPESLSVLDVLYRGISTRLDTIRAAAVVSDVRLRDPDTDAIRVEIEHQEGVVLALLLPYTKKRLGKGVKYGELMASSGERRIWNTAD
jgi:hypothetical protein